MDVPITRLDNWPRVVQLAWILTDFQGRVISEKQFLIRPGNWRIQPGALKVHGITLGYAKRHGRPLTEVLQRFALDLLQTDSIVGHNVQFDQKILGAEFVRVGQTNPLQRRHAQCTMKIGARYLQRPSWQAPHVRPPSWEAGHSGGQPRSAATASAAREQLEQPTVGSPAGPVPGANSRANPGPWGEQGDGVSERLEVATRVEAVAENVGEYRVSRAPAIEGATWRDAGSGFRYPSLRRLHLNLFGQAFSNAHDALADTRACMNCFFEMCRQTDRVD
jgi:DNA polymerase III epsilon subunit-like protein